MIEIDNIIFECFVATIVIIGHKEWIITKLYKKIKDTEQRGYIFSFYLLSNMLSNMLKSLFGIFGSCVLQTRQRK